MNCVPIVNGGMCRALLPRAATLVESAGVPWRVQTAGSGTAPSAPSKLSHKAKAQGLGSPPMATPPADASVVLLPSIGAALSADASALGAVVSASLPELPP